MRWLIVFSVSLACLVGLGCAKPAPKLDGLWTGKAGQGSYTFQGQNFTYERSDPQIGIVDIAGTFTLQENKFSLNPQTVSVKPSKPTDSTSLSDSQKQQIMDDLKKKNPSTLNWNSEDSITLTDPTGKAVGFERVDTNQKD